MAFWNWIEARAARLTALDIGLLKLCVAAFVLMVAKLWPPLLTPNWTVFAAIFAVTYVPLMFKMLIKRDAD